MANNTWLRLVFLSAGAFWLVLSEMTILQIDCYRTPPLLEFNLFRMFMLNAVMLPVSPIGLCLLELGMRLVGIMEAGTWEFEETKAFFLNSLTSYVGGEVMAASTFPIFPNSNVLRVAIVGDPA
ncbi:hypothetical protein L6452_17937 [Arctium lappa]|uniref:Uncharacterized protein n=1 Tax=Arctium lappa TaxID=4217 RepID=A0ACB9C4R9_ARCLA|nr:hypothetical protein L6452_17937 [Arctium lappa]